MSRDSLHYRTAAVVGRPGSKTAVATFLTPTEQQRVDAAGQGCYVTLHRECVDDLMTDLRTRAVSAVLVSVARYQAQDAPSVARLVREFPRVPAVALLTSYEARTTQSLLALGQHGVRALVDTRDPKGWRELRHLVTTEREDLIEQQAVRHIRDDLVGAPDGCLRFFDTIFRSPAYVSTVQQIARTNNVLPSTFMSRFFRVRLPAPKQYLAVARLVRAARLFENPGYSITHVSNHLEYSSAQSFSRHVRLHLSCTPMDFRRRYNGVEMLNVMREQLVLPYRDILLQFDPFATTPQWSVLRGTQ